MPKLFKTHWRFVLVLIIVIIVAIFRFQKGIIQQDNYVGYAEVFPNPKNLSFYDWRLFPGYPVAISALAVFVRSYVLSGYLIIFLSFIGSYIILYKITGSKYSFVPLIFPPIMLGQATLVATECPAIFLILLGVYLLKSKKFLLSSLMFGLGLWVRLIAAVPFAGIALIFLKEREFKKLSENIAVFLFPIASLFAYNSVFFGHADLFRQFGEYANFGPMVIGAIQVFIDIPRAYRWGWYGIFLSGSFYLIFTAAILMKSYEAVKKQKSHFNFQVFVIILAMTVFVFSVTFNPFLENMGRYMAPVFPLFWLLLYKKYRSELLTWLLLLTSTAVVLI